MNGNDSMARHLNAFNTMVSQLFSIDIEIFDEDNCISILCYFPYTWHRIVIVIRINTTTLNFDDVVASFPLEEMR